MSTPVAVRQRAVGAAIEERTEGMRFLLRVVVSDESWRIIEERSEQFEADSDQLAMLEVAEYLDEYATDMERANGIQTD